MALTEREPPMVEMAQRSHRSSISVVPQQALVAPEAV